MTRADPVRDRRTTVAAFGLFAVVLAEIGTAVVGGVRVGFGLAEYTETFTLTNSVIALSCAVAGVLLAWQRPRNPLGWLLLAAGVFQGGTAAMSPLVLAGVQGNWPEPVIRTITTAYLFSWPWSIGLCLPLALLVFPDGLLPGPRWRWVARLAVLNGVLFAASLGTGPAGLLPDPRVRSWLQLPFSDALAPLWLAVELVNAALLLAALAGLGVRYRRGDERTRRQLLWLILAVIVTAVLVPLWGIFELTPVMALLIIALPPAAMTIAVLRHQLLDIRLVFSRTVLYGLLTAGVVIAYLGLVAVADVVLRRDAGVGASVLVTVVIAVGFNPVRVRLQRLVDHALYGDRADPVRAVSRLGERLAGGAAAGPGDALQVVREALRLPYAALVTGGVERASDGTPTEQRESVPLIWADERIGELVVGVRSGQWRLDPADRAVLELLAAPLAVAVRATALSAEVQSSRERIVAAREEERRRLRRDLHDGLGPALTGMAFGADAAGNLLRADPERAAELLTLLRAQAGEAIADVRRLVYELRPPSLDELGLVGALLRHVEQREIGPIVAIEAPPELPVLPAAVEVAAYRIAMEALTNAARHSGADRVDVRLSCNGGLEIDVTDDGHTAAPWTPGVGLTSIGERAAELGGQWTAGPSDAGGRVWARLPLEILR